jgi:hypothetical protein
VDIIHDHGLYYLHQIVDPRSMNIWHQGWMDSRRLGFPPNIAVVWDAYVLTLSRAHIRLSDRKDEII